MQICRERAGDEANADIRREPGDEANADIGRESLGTRLMQI